LFKKCQSVHNKFENKKVTQGGMDLSPKELLYIEDALAHTKFMKEKCQHAAGQVQDEELKQLLEKLSNKHQTMFDNIYGLLND